MKRLIPVVIALALMAAIAYFAFWPEYRDYRERNTYSEEWADLQEYFNLSGDEAEVAIILQDEIIGEQALFWDDTYYFDLATVHKYFNSRFYVDKREGLLLYSLPDDTVRTEIGTNLVITKDGEEARGYEVARYEGETLYIAADFVKEYTNFTYKGFQNPGRMQVYTEWGTIYRGKIVAAPLSLLTPPDGSDDTAVRILGGVKSDILTKIVNGTAVTVLEQMETWAKVKTDDGFIGYVENRRLGIVYNEGQVPASHYSEPEFASQTRDHLISLGWHYIGGPAGNDTIREVTRNTKGLNVISPTWFFLNDSEGNFTSFASNAYVRAAHEMDLEVWALIENITYNDEVDMQELLSSTSKRAYLIENLIATALEYNIDGINVDFEDLRAETGPHFVQFIRELSIACREQELVLSVDNYVPFNFNEFYNRAEQGVFADYIIIMGYDEHYSGSETAGSVASIGFVQEGIIRTAEQVPAHKVINGVPFYTRLWETSGASVSSQALRMEVAQNWVANRNITPEWDDVTCQNYVEYRDNEGVLHQMWLEDAASLRVKLNVMKANEIGGVAFWQLGQETADVWDVVVEYLGVQ
uniref:Chitinase Chi18A n=1 Tax=uncultured bacterium contig00048 TaxID=1181533 RepID=A0A806KHD3_9BACT|nr:chitinase Chi18A [uncultured bacterium contig00048]